MFAEGSMAAAEAAGIEGPEITESPWADVDVEEEAGGVEEEEEEEEDMS